MPFYAPLRYPGGKRRLFHLVAQLVEANRLHDVEYVEPYAGGASLGLALLFNEYASTVHINDLSRPVFAFWKSTLEDTESFRRKIESTQVTIEEWYRQHQVYLNREKADLFDLGFATFFLNRTNRSGIISGRPIGGLEQTGRWKLDARYNSIELARRIRKIGRYRTRISVSQLDASMFIENVSASVGPNALFFIDPPYIDRGSSLYLDHYTLENHESLERQVTALVNHWIVTYDYDAALRHQLYRDHRRLSFLLSYSAQRRRRGREAMFVSDSIKFPEDWHDAGQMTIGPVASKYPLAARVEKVN